MKNLSEYINEALVYEKQMKELHISKKEAEKGDDFVEVPANIPVNAIDELENGEDA